MSAGRQGRARDFNGGINGVTVGGDSKEGSEVTHGTCNC